MKIDVEEVQNFMKDMGPETKVYFGVDSERFKLNGKWYADYICTIVIHIDGCKGGKIFAEVTRELDYDQKIERPFNRMMSETMKVAELYLRTEHLFRDFEVEIHLDIASDERWGSNCAATTAAGYIKGTCNIDPVLKPNAFAASFCADRAKELLGVHAEGVYDCR